MPQIRTVRNLREYFRQSVVCAMQRNGVTVDEHTSYYVVNLLTLYARSERLFTDGENGLELKPVAGLLAEAVDCDRQERHRALQRVGDQSLFIAGFLAEGLKTRLVDVDYYIKMGGSAYASLSVSISRSARERALGSVYSELAERFLDLVDVLTDLREEASSSAKDLLRIYEVWARTGSRRAARLLRSQGIEPLERLRLPLRPH